jgi:hypothetical protein
LLGLFELQLFLMASLVHWCAPLPQLHGRASAYDGQITLGLLRGNVDKPVDYLPSSNKCQARRLVSTQFKSQRIPVRRNCLKVQAVAETVQQGKTSVHESPTEKFHLLLEAARTEDKLKAAATLRARSFYLYPEGRSRDALVVHILVSH